MTVIQSSVTLNNVTLTEKILLNISPSNELRTRDYFAGQIMSSLSATLMYRDDEVIMKTAIQCYKIADAMLAASKLEFNKVDSNSVQ